MNCQRSRCKFGLRMTTDLKFRQASAKDAEAAAPLVYSAGPEAFDYILNTAERRALDFLVYAFAEGAGFQGYRNHWVAVRAGRTIGVGAFYSGQDEVRLARGFVRQVFAFYPFAVAPSVIKRSREVASMMTPLSRDMLYVANFGVAPECRGQGVGAALLTLQMHHARRMGYRRYALDVSSTNLRAQKLYESLGFEFVRERPFRGDSERAPVPDCRRLEMRL